MMRSFREDLERERLRRATEFILRLDLSVEFGVTRSGIVWPYRYGA